MINEEEIIALRDAAESADLEAIDRILKSFTGLTKRLKTFIDAFINALNVKLVGDESVSIADVKRLPEYKRMMDAIQKELEDFSAILASEVKMEVERSEEAGANDALTLLSLVLGISASDASKTLNTISEDDVMKILSKYLSEDGALMQRIRNMAGFGADMIKEIIEDGVALGRNPLTIADQIIETGLGVPLTNAMRWTRTVQLYSYRWANLASFDANSNVVKGWIWWAELDDLCCMSCVSLHGTLFNIEDGIADDHHSGRCSMLPHVPGLTDELVKSGAGKEWFDGLPEDQQRAMMGTGKFDAYQNGQFEFNQLSSFREDEVFGTMRVETPLKDLVPPEE